MNKISNKRIFIVGHHGAGKALLAKTLAEKLGWQFVNADLGLEAKVGRYLAEIVGKPYGVKAFFKCQTEILKNQLKKESIVVTTDASLLADEVNQQLLSSEFVIYLKVSTPVQIERSLRSAATLLPVENYENFLNEMHKERDHVYEKAANIRIDSDDNDLNGHESKVLEVLLKEGMVSEISEKIKLERKDFILFHKTKYTPLQLTEQQARCLKLLAEGKTSKEIGNKLNISYRTVEEYLAKIIEESGCSSSKDLIALYHTQP